MKRIYLQYWEESERGWGVRPDGCSLHLTQQNHKDYIKSILEDRDPNNVPHEYDMVVGGLIPVEVKESLYHEVIKSNGSLRLHQTSLSNLLLFEEINTMIQ